VQNLATGAVWSPGFAYPYHTFLVQGRNPVTPQSYAGLKLNYWKQHTTGKARTAGCSELGLLFCHFYLYLLQEGN
jgi:hypothetical protein